MYFEEIVTFRLRSDDIKKIECVLISDGGEKYDNLSHFVRCAVLEKLRKEKVIKNE